MKRPLFLTTALTCALFMASCATFAPPSVTPPPSPPRREMPETARASCQVPPPPVEISIPALKAYAGQLMGGLVKCDVARALAVDVHDGEHADEDAWRNAVSPGAVVGGG